MSVLNRKPISMAEVAEYAKASGTKDENILAFIKKFSELKPKEAKELKSKLEEFDMIKLKEESIVKIVDILPDTSEDLNKIFVGISLDEDETKKILDTIKQYK
jgi:DNA-directed RNA polymerase subunit F